MSVAYTHARSRFLNASNLLITLPVHFPDRLSLCTSRSAAFATCVAQLGRFMIHIIYAAFLSNNECGTFAGTHVQHSQRGIEDDSDVLLRRTGQGPAAHVHDTRRPSRQLSQEVEVRLTGSGSFCFIFFLSIIWGLAHLISGVSV